MNNLHAAMSDTKNYFKIIKNHCRGHIDLPMPKVAIMFQVQLYHRIPGTKTKINGSSKA